VAATWEIGFLAQSQVPFYSRTELAGRWRLQQANQSALLAGEGVFAVGIGEHHGTLAIAYWSISTNRAAEVADKSGRVSGELRAVGAVHALPARS